jgi:putative membrane protein
VAGITVNSILTAIVVSACLVFLNMVVKPIISILTLPLNILTLGLFSIVINGAFFWFVGQIIQGFSVSSFKDAIIGAFVISIITWIIGKFVGHDN